MIGFFIYAICLYFFVYRLIKYKTKLIPTNNHTEVATTCQSSLKLFCHNVGNTSTTRIKQSNAIVKAALFNNGNFGIICAQDKAYKTQTNIKGTTMRLDYELLRLPETSIFKWSGYITYIFRVLYDKLVILLIKKIYYG